MKTIKLTEKQLKYCLSKVNEATTDNPVTVPVQMENPGGTVTTNDIKNTVDGARKQGIANPTVAVNASQVTECVFTKKQLAEARLNRINATGKHMTKKDFRKK